MLDGEPPSRPVVEQRRAHHRRGRAQSHRAKSRHRGGPEEHLSQKIESAKATMFLMDAGGKVLSQKTGWMIGGATNRPPLAPDHQSKYYFVLPAGETFSKAKLMLNRVVL